MKLLELGDNLGHSKLILMKGLKNGGFLEGSDIM